MPGGRRAGGGEGDESDDKSNTSDSIADGGQSFERKSVLFLESATVSEAAASSSCNSAVMMD
jgi:hypothetical protein